MARPALILLASIVLATGCGGGGKQLTAAEERAEVRRIEPVASSVISGDEARACALLTARFRNAGGCREIRKVQAGFRTSSRRSAPTLSAGVDEIEDGRVHFTGRDRASVVLCYGSGGCVSDLGAEELRLERAGRRWLIDGHEYHVEDF